MITDDDNANEISCGPLQETRETRNRRADAYAEQTMTTISIPSSDDRMRQLRDLAARAGVAPEQLARAGLEDWLSQPRDDFLEAARHVLRKNAELYRRLA